MRIKFRLPAATWTLGDQTLVSAGSFVANMVIARNFPPAEYGTFSLIMLLILALSTFTGSVLLYPMGVRATVAPEADRAEVFGGGLVLLFVGCAPLCAALAAMLAVLHRVDLIWPVLIWFVLRQVQELLRRALFAEMRHAAAVPGDTICYLGQAAGLVALAHFHMLTLADAILVMAATTGLAALVQAAQVPIRFGRLERIRRFAREWLALGAGSLGSNLLATLRLQFFPWLLAAAGGTVAAANFQAAWNLVQLTNPIVLGLCNMIPQTAARGRIERGNEQAWRAARPLMMLGALPVLGYYALLCVIPGTVLTVFYGSSSAYTQLGLVVQAITLAAALTYPADMICSYLHGIEGVRLAMRINLGGMIASVLLGTPLTLAFGVTGSCVALFGANLARTILAYQVLNGVLTHDRRRYA